MLRTENPDVVFVLVPTGGQTVVALTAERQKCYLITEIPYALTLNYSDTTAETYQQNGVKWGIAENVWLWPNWDKLHTHGYGTNRAIITVSTPYG